MERSEAVPRGTATLQPAARPWIPRAYTLSWQDAHESGAIDGMGKLDRGLGLGEELRALGVVELEIVVVLVDVMDVVDVVEEVEAGLGL
jgi:hypothetical protein